MKKTATIGAAVLVVLVSVGGYLRYGARPDPLSPELESARRLEPGPRPVERRRLTLTDSSRRTPAYGEFPGADSRTLETTVWYPRDLASPTGGPADEPLPLLIYSHGFMSSRTGGAYLSEHLASRGYLVAAADHPLTSSGAPGGPFIRDVARQPGDIGFLLDRFLAWHRQSGHPFEGAVDEDRIGVVGLSLGGLTATLAAFHPRLADSRIDAAVSIAGPTFMLARRFFRERELPFMMVATDTDAIVDYRSNAVPITEKVQGALLVTLAGGSHTGFADPARFLRFLDNPDELGCAAVTANLDGSGSWWKVLGSPSEGIVWGAPPALCADEGLPEAMNPLHQQRVTRLAVTAFFQSLFADGAEERARHRDYVTEVLSRELPAVSVEGSGAGPGTGTTWPGQQGPGDP